MNDELPMTNGGKEPAGSPAIRHSSFAFLNSIRWRLQIWYGLILVAVLAGFGATAFQLERGPVYRPVDDELQRRADALRQLFRQPPRDRGPEGPRQGPPGEPGFDGPPADPRPEGPRRRDFNGDPQGQRDFHLPPMQARLFDETDTNGFYYVIWRPDGTELAHSTNAPALVRKAEPMPMKSDRVAANPINNVTGPPELRGPPRPQPPQMNGIFRESTLLMPRGEKILVGRSIAPQLHELRSMALVLTGVGAGILLLGLLGGWWLAARAIRPIDDISATAVKISAGDLSQRINVAETESELGRLASVLNSTFARLDAAFAQQQQFTSDAAHELRTPVSVMLTQTQTTLTRERSAAEYRETLESCQRAAQRMRRLIESLLELARLDAGQQQMKRLRFDLAQTARDCVTLIGPLAETRHVKISCELPPLECVGDSERLSQVITNLLTNAITYNKENGEVRVHGETKNGSVILTVSDNGVGISAEALPRVFDRFYRADSSRTSGNTGLGLAISKAIVEAHGGGIEVASEVGVGTAFTLRLPTASEQK
jgi:two-component system, OmpR family, sensor kinase